MFSPIGVTEELSPGDLFPPGWDDDRANDIGPVVVFSHACDIAKSKTVLVADFVPAEATEVGLLGHIRAERVFHALMLVGSPIDGWVNLRTLRAVPREVLTDAMHKRIGSMTDDGRVMLAAKVFQFLTRSKPSG